MSNPPKIATALVKLFLSFLLLHIIGKIIFVSYHRGQFLALKNYDKFGVFTHGLRMDLAMASYMIALPIVFVLLSVFFKNSTVWLQKIFRVYAIIICFIVSCIFIVDIEMYRTWHFRIDNSPLKYFHHPAEMLASTGASPYHILIPILLALFTVIYYWQKKVFAQQYRFSTINKALRFALYLLCLAALIIPIRGGLQLAPLNQSTVYFSDNNFANHAAVNAVFNFVHSISKRQNGENPFSYLPKNEAQNIVNETLKAGGLSRKTLKNTRPNVLLITWESLTAKALEPKLCDGYEVLPNLKKLSREGLYFSNCYASGDRSDKGLVAILSGYPAQPIASIMTIPQKTSKLPVLSQNFKKLGYSTAWYYGGEPEFANIKTYINHGQFDRLVTKNDYPSQYTNTKWGANDQHTFDRLFADLQQQKQPFFVNTFTLSSHEPFEIPNHKVIPGNSEKRKFLNALNYTDKQLGLFIEKIKKQPWYANTLVIIIADHGHRLPETPDKLEEFKIPMLWLGGALEIAPAVFDKLVSQTDLAATLLRQLNVPSGAYMWSKDCMLDTYQPSAYFAFRNGMGYLEPEKHVVFDNDTRKVIQATAPNDTNIVKKAQAYVQETYGDFLLK
jgi:phosphoglycerol transferase MdoB-like AlkP superfamily enzyme